MKHTMKKLLAALLACLLLVGSVAALADDPTNDNEFTENTPDELEGDLTTLTGEGGNDENEENNDNTFTPEQGLEYGGGENALSLAPNGGASYRGAAYAADLSITIDPVGGGTVTQTDMGADLYECTANPAAGYTFLNWTYTLTGSPETSTDRTKRFDSSISGDITAHFVQVFPLWVGGTQVTSANAGNILGDGTASYDANTHTLQLNGFNYTGPGSIYTDIANQKYHAAICYTEEYDGSLEIKLIGNNTVSCNASGGSTEYVYGIFDGRFPSGGLIVSGEGSLNVSATSGATYDYGISSYGDITFKGGTVTATSTGPNGRTINARNVTISGGTVTTVGTHYGIHATGTTTISGGTVDAEGRDGIRGDRVVISGGTVKAAGTGHYGIVLGSNGVVEIGANVGSVTVSGKDAAIDNRNGNRVINAVSGTGWTDRDGTAGKAGIPVSAAGQSLDYKKVQFPGESLPSAEVTTKPTAKTLTYNGQAQELVTAGKADGGDIYYELGTDAVNAPSGMGADKAIPTGTEVGTYYVWYKAVGDVNHTDSAAKCVTVTIAPKKEETQPEPAPAPQPEPAPAQPQPQPEPAPAPAEPAPAPAEPAPAPVPVDPREVLITTSTSTGDFSFNTTWNAVQGADGYDVFFTYCSNYDFKLVATVPAGQPLSYDFAGLNKYHGYKVIIKAWQGASGNYIKESPVAHCYTGGGTAKLSNPGSLTLKKTALTIKLGKSATVGATVKGVKKGKVIAHDGKVRYLSSDPSVVTISRGKMKAVGAGACTVYVLTTNGIYQPVAVTVDANPTSVKLSKPTRGMKIGQTQALGAKVVLKPKGAVTTLSWVSSKPEVVSVDAYGNVTALSKGRATITVTTANGKKTKLNIRVK